MKDILIAWIAGSGKWTQARALEKHFGEDLQYFEPGSILRAFTSNDNIVWDYAKTFTSAGKLLPDAFMRSVLGLVFASLEPWKRLLIDWFPRMYGQKKMFEDAMVEHSRDFIIFYLDISDEEAEKRLFHRKICSVCGTTYSTLLQPWITSCEVDSTILSTRVDDQSVAAVHERCKIFHNETYPIISDYEKVGKVVKIDWMLSIEDITSEILKHL
jgi:adenylate kinase